MARFVRLLLALAPGVAVLVLVHAWRVSPRLVLPHEHIAWHIAFSPDGSRLAVLDREAGVDVRGQVLVWDVATGTLLNRLDYGVRPYPSRLAFAPDGRTLGIVDAGRIEKWDLAAGRIQAAYDHPGWSHDPDHYPGRELLFGAGGRWLAHDLCEGRVYDVETGAVVRDYAAEWPDRSVHAGGGCVAAYVGGRVTTFDAVTGTEVGRFPKVVPRVPLARGAFFAGAGGISGITCTADKQWVFYSAATGTELAWGHETDGLIEFNLSPDRRYLAVLAWEPAGGVISAVRARIAGGETNLRVYDTTTGAEVFGPILRGSGACFAPDGSLLALADMGTGEVRVWDWPPPPRWPWALALGIAAVAVSSVIVRVQSQRRLRSGASRGSGGPAPPG